MKEKVRSNLAVKLIPTVIFARYRHRFNLKASYNVSLYASEFLRNPRLAMASRLADVVQSLPLYEHQEKAELLKSFRAIGPVSAKIKIIERIHLRSGNPIAQLLYVLSQDPAMPAEIISGVSLRPLWGVPRSEGAGVPVRTGMLASSRMFEILIAYLLRKGAQTSALAPVGVYEGRNKHVLGPLHSTGVWGLPCSDPINGTTFYVTFRTADERLISAVEEFYETRDK